MHNLLENSQIRFLKKDEVEDWPVLSKCNVEDGKFLLTFWELPSCRTDALGRKGPRLPNKVVELDEAWTVALRIIKPSPSITTARKMFHYGSLSIFQPLTSCVGVECSITLFVAYFFTITRKKTRDFLVPLVSLHRMASINPGEYFMTYHCHQTQGLAWLQMKGHRNSWWA